MAVLELRPGDLFRRTEGRDRITCQKTDGQGEESGCDHCADDNEAPGPRPARPAFEQAQISSRHECQGRHQEPVDRFFEVRLQEVQNQPQHGEGQQTSDPDQPSAATRNTFDQSGERAENQVRRAEAECEDEEQPPAGSRLSVRPDAAGCQAAAHLSDVDDQRRNERSDARRRDESDGRSHNQRTDGPRLALQSAQQRCGQVDLERAEQTGRQSGQDDAQDTDAPRTLQGPSDLAAGQRRGTAQHREDGSHAEDIKQRQRQRAAQPTLAL